MVARGVSYAMLRSVFCALLLLAAFASPVSGEETKPLRSILLVARPDLPDPNFGDSVVLVTQSAGSLPVGVIINKPTDATIASRFDDIEQVKAWQDKVFNGGPVRPQSLSFIFRASTPPENAIEILDGVYLGTDPEQLRNLLTTEKAGRVRVYTGYSAWSPGQLENEIGRGDWRLTPADMKSIFEAKPQDLWPELRRRTAPRTMAYSDRPSK
jgi:putative transcriptional regulator